MVDVTGGIHDAIKLAKSAAGIEDNEIEIVEYPMPEDKFLEFAKSFTFFPKPDISEFLPEQFSRQLEVLDILPVLVNDEIQLLMPFSITVQ